MTRKEVTVVRYDRRRNHSFDVWQEKKSQLLDMTGEEITIVRLTGGEITIVKYDRERNY